MKWKWQTPSSQILSGILVGAPAGVVAILFFKLVHGGFEQVYGRLVEMPVWQFGCISLGLILGATRLATWLTMRWAPVASGSGISQMKLIYWRDQGFIPIRATIAKLLACGIGLIAGIGLGRRGPSVFICAGIGSLVADIFKYKGDDKKNACAAGAAAGLAACFNTPLAAVTFFLEEVLGDLNSRRLGTVLLASIIGAGVYHLMLGKEPVYPMVADITFNPAWYAAALLAAVISSLVGIVFVKLILFLGRQSKKRTDLPYWLTPIAGAFIGWALSFTAYLFFKTTGLFGTGDIELNRILNGDVPLVTLWVLLILKCLAVCFYYGTGGCGGIFGPLVFLGGASGYAVGATLNTIIDLGPGGPVAMATLGMCACFGCVVKAPVTGILMLFEMTQSFEMLPPLMLVTLVSQAVSSRYTKISIYDSLLIAGGNDPERHIPPRDLDQWLRRPIATLANLKPVALESLDPEHARPILDRCTYNWFPVVEKGIPKGVVSRREIEQSIVEGRQPELNKAISVHPGTSIRETQEKMLHSKSDLALVVDSSQGRLLGILTLRDILRAELNRTS